MKLDYGKGAYGRRRPSWCEKINKPGPIIMKGSHFRTEICPDGYVNIFWSADGETWDPLDFMNAREEEVNHWISKIREGFEI